MPGMGRQIAGAFGVQMHILPSHGPHAPRWTQRSNRPHRRLRHKPRPQRRHHHIDITQRNRRACKQPGLRHSHGSQRVGDLRAINDLGQQRAAMSQPQSRNHPLIIGTVAIVAEGKAGL